jgi:hypothetical protein
VEVTTKTDVVATIPAIIPRVYHGLGLGASEYELNLTTVLTTLLYHDIVENG